MPNAPIPSYEHSTYRAGVNLRQCRIDIPAEAATEITNTDITIDGNWTKRREPKVVATLKSSPSGHVNGATSFVDSNGKPWLVMTLDHKLYTWDGVLNSTPTEYAAKLPGTGSTTYELSDVNRIRFARAFNTLYGVDGNSYLFKFNGSECRAVAGTAQPEAAIKGTLLFTNGTSELDVTDDSNGNLYQGVNLVGTFDYDTLIYNFSPVFPWSSGTVTVTYNRATAQTPETMLRAAGDGTLQYPATNAAFDVGTLTLTGQTSGNIVTGNSVAEGIGYQLLDQYSSVMGSYDPSTGKISCSQVAFTASENVRAAFQITTAQGDWGLNPWSSSLAEPDADNRGTGYVQQDIIYITIPNQTRSAKALIYTVDGNGGATSILIIDPGSYTATTNGSFATTGGQGTGLKISVVSDSWAKCSKQTASRSSTSIQLDPNINPDTFHFREAREATDMPGGYMEATVGDTNTITILGTSAGTYTRSTGELVLTQPWSYWLGYTTPDPFDLVFRYDYGAPTTNVDVGNADADGKLYRFATSQTPIVEKSVTITDGTHIVTGIPTSGGGTLKDSAQNAVGTITTAGIIEVTTTGVFAAFSSPTITYYMPAAVSPITLVFGRLSAAIGGLTPYGGQDILWWNNRLWITGDNSLAFSDAYAPESFSQPPLAVSATGKLKLLGYSYNRLYLFNTEAGALGEIFYVDVSDTTPANWKAISMFAGMNFVSSDCIVRAATNDSADIFYRTAEGWRSLKTTVQDHVAGPSLPFDITIRPWDSELNKAAIAASWAIVFNDELLCWQPKTGSGVPSLVFAYNMNIMRQTPQDGWTRIDMPTAGSVTGIEAHCGAKADFGAGERLYIGSATGGKVVEMFGAETSAANFTARTVSKGITFDNRFAAFAPMKLVVRVDPGSVGTYTAKLLDDQDTEYTLGTKTIESSGVKNWLHAFDATIATGGTERLRPSADWRVVLETNNNVTFGGFLFMANDFKTRFVQLDEANASAQTGVDNTNPATTANDL